MKLIVGMKEFEQPPAEGIVSVHHPVSPAEVYAGQPITATLVNPKTNVPHGKALSVFRLSPLGAEIDVTGLSNFNCEIGQELDLQLFVAKQQCDFRGIAVASMQVDNGRRLVGFRWCQTTQSSDSQSEKRKAARWLCGEHFLPTGVAPNPAKFNDFVYFSVVDISRSGMQLSTSLRNKFLIPGMVLESVVSFPLIGQLTLHFRITNARIRSMNGKDYLALGTELLEEDSESLETLGQYLMQFGPQLSALELKKSGFQILSVESAVNYGFVKTAEDYREVLELRKAAYAQSGKADSSKPVEAMSDMFDTRSRILYARHNNKVVGSLRLTFHAPDESNEYDQFVKFPQDFPRRDEVVVVSRVCTNPEYRGSDLVYGLIRQCVLAVLQSRRRYILGGSSDALLPLYRKLGFKPQGLYFEHQSLKGVKEQIVLGDVLGILSGADTSVAIWNELYSDLTRYIAHLYEVPFTPGMNMRLALFRSVAPVTRLFTASVRNPRKKSS